MPNVQQPEMRRSGQTRLVQDSDGPPAGTASSPSREHRSVPPAQASPYGPHTNGSDKSEEPRGRPAEGD
jgi:hypothetical protein